MLSVVDVLCVLEHDNCVRPFGQHPAGMDGHTLTRLQGGFGCITHRHLACQREVGRQRVAGTVGVFGLDSEPVHGGAAEIGQRVRRADVFDGHPAKG